MARTRGAARLSAGPWRGVIDATDPDEATEHLLSDAHNMVIPDPAHGSGAYQRPGVQPLNALASLSGTVQGILDHTRGDGTIDRLVVGGGKLYRWDGTTAFTDVTPANMSLATTGRVGLVSFADRVLVTDGVSNPWVFDPATNTGAVISAETPTTLLSRSGTDDRAIQTPAFWYACGATSATQKTAQTAVSLGALGTIAINQWRAIRVSINAGGTIGFTMGASDQASEAAAIAAVPAVPANAFDLGYFTVQANGPFWTAGTDALAGGATGSPAQATHYYAPRAVQWAAFGPPTIYAAKAFWIASTVQGVNARNTFYWCEEGQPTVGYQQTNYDDQWEFTQTSSDAIVALHGTNLGLYVLRLTSIALVTGTVDATFRTASTQDDVSLTVGCGSPWSVVQAEGALYFCDRDGRPYRLPFGGELQPIWLQMRRATDSAIATASVSSVNTTILANATAAYWPSQRVVLMVLWTTTTAYAFHAETGTYLGRHDFYVSSGTGHAIAVLGNCRDASGNPLLCYGVSGVVWLEKAANIALPWQDGGNALVSRSIPCSVTTHDMGFDPQRPFAADTITASLGGTSRGLSVELGVISPYGQSATLNAYASSPSASPFGTADTVCRATWGTLEQGRYLRCQVGQSLAVTARVIVYGVVVNPMPATAMWEDP